jgi:hypothetical protein
MAKRKIADCINIRIRTGDYQHIEIVKYAEEEIEYSNDQERIDCENKLTNDLFENIMRSMKSIADKTGKGKSEVIEVEQAIAKAIPEWLSNDPVPNIANNAKKVLNTVSNKQKEEKDSEIEIEKSLLNCDSKLKENVATSTSENSSNEKIEEKIEEKSTDESLKTDEENLLEPIEDIVEPIEELKETIKSEENVTQESKESEFELFDGEDDFKW